MAAFSAPKGVPDYVPPRSEALLAVRDAMIAPLRLAGYGYLELPVFEDTALFARGVGETSDVVSKEMFTFEDRGGRSVTLRPEGTVGAVRAVLEAGLERGALPVKLWYAGSMFRYEQPQSGRQRQFVQVGAEALGADDPALDAELIALADMAYRALGLTQTVLHLGTLGDPEDRTGYSARLRDWLKPRVGGLDAETDRRIERNPLRVLDDKRPEVRTATADAPLLTEDLSPAARAHHDAVRAHLTDLGVTFSDDPRLVRGLDYYRRTTFEFVHPLLGAQATIGAGGRYDGLSEAIGGPPLPGVGWALGVDRTLLALEAEQLTAAAPSSLGVFFVPLGADAKALSVRLTGELRRAGVGADLVYGERGMKGAMKAAERSGAPYAVVLGERDLAAGEAQLKDLRTHEQSAVPLADLISTLKGEAPVIRTAEAGTLRAESAGTTVTLAGWIARRRDHGGVAFLDLRDRSGIAQVVIRDEAVASGLRNEFCVAVTGTVGLRPEGSANPNLPSGEVEVTAETVEVLSEAAPLPFPIDDHVEVGEEARLRHRYLDLRRSGPAAAMRLRSDVNRAAREVLHAEGFLEIETPTLTRSTPEGARDFLVPVRLQPGSWYALPQSPQLFKQLLMVGGLERYYQIARCYRDEDFRADRQPEFTQLDIEMSFVDQDDVIAVGEKVVSALWALIGHEIPLPIPRITYAESMRRYGNDKPDLRFGQELVECTEYFKDTPFRVFQAEYVGAVVMPGGASQPRKQLDAWQEWAKQRGARGLAYVLFQEDGTITGPVAKNLSETELAGLADHVGAKPGDCVFFAAGEVPSSRGLLAAARLEVGRRCGLIDESQWSFVWVVDAPLFEPAAQATAGGDVAVGKGAWTAVHHAFTSPKPEWIDRFEEDPGSALAYAYDIVCNGNELGGGSIRIHRRDVQQRVFALMGIGEEEAQDKFGFLLDAFSYGPPPHGGIALGWDRVCMLLAGADSLRDVIAFPKTGAGFDPLTGAPTPITAEQRKEAGVDALPAPADQ